MQQQESFVTGDVGLVVCYLQFGEIRKGEPNLEERKKNKQKESSLALYGSIIGTLGHYISVVVGLGLSYSLVYMNS